MEQVLQIDLRIFVRTHIFTDMNDRDKELNLNYIRTNFAFSHFYILLYDKVRLRVYHV